MAKKVFTTNHPAFSHLQTHTFGVDEAAGVITGAPLFQTININN